MKIKWTEPAVLDLESIRDYISRDSEYFASEFIEKIIDVVEKLSVFPKKGRKVPEIDDENIREIIYYSYRIIYRIEALDSLLVLGIIHAARDMNNLILLPWEIK